MVPCALVQHVFEEQRRIAPIEVRASHAFNRKLHCRASQVHGL